MLVLFPILFQKTLLQMVFPKEGWPMGDHVSFFQEVPRDLRYYSNLFVCRRETMIQISGHSSLGIRNKLGGSVILT